MSDNPSPTKKTASPTKETASSKKKTASPTKETASPKKKTASPSARPDHESRPNDPAKENPRLRTVKRRSKGTRNKPESTL